MVRLEVEAIAIAEEQTYHRLGVMAFPLIRDTREMALYLRETLGWHRRNAARPPRPLPENFSGLCPDFSLLEAELAVAEFGIPELVQATFYAMLLNDAVEFGTAHEFTGDEMKSVLMDLKWSSFEKWVYCMDDILRAAQQNRPADEINLSGADVVQGGVLDLGGPPSPSSDEA